MKTLLYILLLLNIQACLFAQNKSEDHLGSWYVFSLNHRFTEKFSITPYSELRFFEPTSNYNLTFVSLRGNYHLKPNQTIGIAYAYLDIDSYFGDDKTPNTMEHRITEQYTFKHKWNALTINHRFRLEQRFLDYSNRNETQHRMRYRFAFKYDINKTLFLGLSEEGFVNFQDQVFHENRFFVGVGFNLANNVQLKLDYLKHHIRKNNLNRIQVGISIRTDSRKSTSASKLR